jgi:hypothetical protein
MESDHFLFVGTAKAGTTSIYHYLNQHPKISIPVKETFYFLKDVYTDFSLGYPQQRSAEDLILDEKTYRALYPTRHDVVYGEIGTGYLYHYHDSIPLIKKMLGTDVRILIILRNPVDRAYSSYMHFVKDTHEKLSFSESIAKEEERRRRNYDFMWMHRDLGLYASQVKAFMNEFPNVKILFTEEFQRDPEKTLREILSFLGIDPEFPFDTQRQYNKSGEPKFKSLQKVLTTENPIKQTFRPIFRAMFPKEKRVRLRKKLKNLNIASYPEMSESTRQELASFYRADIESLEKLLGYPIKVWRE